VIVLSGEVDLDVADQMSHVAHEAAARELPIRVDVRAATFIDSSAMTMFVRLVMTERRHKRDVVVVGASPVIRTALQTAGIARLLAFEDAE
jgi:anti-anti-sigma factor